MEGAMLCHALRLATGQPLYAPPSAAFVSFAYVPLYPAIVALLARVFGLGYALGRGVSVAFLVLALGAAYALVRREGGGRDVALAAAALPAAAFAPTGAWYDLVRIDSLFLGLAACGVVLAWTGRRSDGRVLAAALLLAAAFFAKQTAAPLIVVTALALLLSDRRRAALFAATVAVVCGVAGVWLQARTHGWFATYAFGLHQRHGFDLRAALLVTPLRWALLLGPGLGLLPWAVSRARSAGLAYASALAAAGLGASMLGAGTQWAYHNALIPAVFFGGLAIAVAAAQLAAATPSPRREWLVPAALALSVLCAGGGLVWAVDRVAPGLGLALPTGYDPRGLWPDAEDRARGDALVARLRAEEGAVFVPFHPYYAHLAGKPASLHAMNLADLSGAGLGTPRDLVEAIRSRAYALVVLDEEEGPRLPEERAQEALAQFPRLAGHYEVVERFEGPRVFSGAPVRPRLLLRPRP
jgi:glycosyl transferase family 87